jgi:hypothetical protein
VFPEFADECVYLDIETTGLSTVFDSVTVVGLYDGRRYSLFTRGDNLDQVQGALAKYSVVVTFNGSGFDQACSSSDGTYFLFLFFRTQSFSATELSYSSGDSWSITTTCSKVLAPAGTTAKCRGVAQLGLPRRLDKRASVGRPTDVEGSARPF